MPLDVQIGITATISSIANGRPNFAQFAGQVMLYGDDIGPRNNQIGPGPNPSDLIFGVQPRPGGHMDSRADSRLARPGDDVDHGPIEVREIIPLGNAHGCRQVLSATERILLPENHATLGNSGVYQVNADEAWVTCAESSLARGKRAGEHNHVLLARLRAAD